jgi:3-hydroxyisobutyrate dehydrogenase-like beta-hydroxyacid dehydrogenase/CBS domain-containing protein
MHTLGIIGTGIQGTAIVQQLIENGVQVAVYDHIEAEMAKSESLGATLYYDAISFLQNCKIVFVILPAGPAPLEFFSRPMVQKSINSSHLIVQMGTASVESTTRLERIIKHKNGCFVECVIGGPIVTIMDKTCPLFFAGSTSNFNKLEDMCQHFGKLMRVGEIGNAAAFNLASLAHVYSVVHGFSLASAMMERSKLDIEQWLDFVNNGIAGHPGEFLTKFLWPAHLEGRSYGLIGPAQVKNDGAQQEAKLIVHHARSLQLDTGMVNAIQSLHQKAFLKGKNLDWSSFYDYLAPVSSQFYDRGDDRTQILSAKAPLAAKQATDTLADLDISSLLNMLPRSLVVLTVREGIQNQDPIAFLDMTMQEVSEIFRESAISDLPVLDRETGQFLGIVSEGDLLRATLPDFSEIISIDSSLQQASTHLMSNARRIMDRSISNILISNPIVLHPDQDILAAAVMMVEKMIRRLPVIEDGRYLGSISRADICWAVLHQAKSNQ